MITGRRCRHCGQICVARQVDLEGRPAHLSCQQRVDGRVYLLKRLPTKRPERSPEESEDLAMAVTCPTCKATAGTPCTKRATTRSPQPWHMSRVDHGAKMVRGGA